MNCSQASSLLSLYLDDELDDLSRKRVDLHVQRCPVCSHDLATLAKTVRVLRFAADRKPENDSPCFTHPGTDKKSLMNRCDAICKVKRRLTDE
jgi:predicted anti-sigma-YlaC factor YlaD